MIKAVIFDLDGVIVSTDQLHYEAWKHIADREHIDFDQSINHQLRGVSRMASLEIILTRSNHVYTQEQKEQLATIKNSFYVKLLKQLSPSDLLPHVKEVLIELKKRDIKIAIGSSSKNTKTILKQVKLENMFDVIADGHDVKHSKPAPDIFLVAAKRLHVNPKDCAVVEDAIAGIEAAKHAKMTAIAVSDAKKSNLADYRFDDIREILKLI